VGIDRRDFLKVATAGAGLALAGAAPGDAQAEGRGAPYVRSGRSPDVLVVGAGAFGMWTALHLRRMGATVHVVDQYGPANSRATSGGETRGVRSSYGDRPHGLQWGKWAVRAMGRWAEWDREHQHDMLPRLFYQTGDVILREEVEPWLDQTMKNWDEMGHEYEVLDPDEVRRRWPAIALPDVGFVLYEPSAGVVRARRAIESVARVFEREGGEIVIGKVALGQQDGRRVADVTVDGSDRLGAGAFVFALGPWFPKFFPDLMGRRLRIRTLGHVYYVSTPPGDESYRVPNLPSYNVPGVTGWPALPHDARGFRIRTGGHRDDDPDTSVRWIDEEFHARPREILARYFPGLADRPFNETRCCHYESSVDRNFIVDHHPAYDNAWLAGGGSAEAFKQGPVLGEDIAGRVLDRDTEPELAEGFRLKDAEVEEEGRD